MFQQIVAFVVVPAGDVEPVQRLLKEKLMTYQMPLIVRVDEMPLLVNGKIDRQKLLAVYAASLQGRLLRSLSRVHRHSARGTA